jgi:hypothetical protein
MRIARDTFLKGSSMFELSGAFFALFLLAACMIFLATHRFKRDLEP